MHLNYNVSFKTAYVMCLILNHKIYDYTNAIFCTLYNPKLIAIVSHSRSKNIPTVPELVTHILTHTVSVSM
jgi:hypothetical protein